MKTHPSTRIPGPTLVASLALAAALWLAFGAEARAGTHKSRNTCGVGPVRVLASFDPAQQELPDGVAVIGGHGHHPGTPLVTFNPKGQAVIVAPDGGYSHWAGFTPFAAFDRLTGVDTDRDGNVYLAVASFAPTIPGEPLPGIYKVPAGGGTPVRHSSPVTPAMTLPNGIERVGDDIYVADSNGFIFKVDSSGTTTLWSDHPALSGNQAACPVPLPTPRPFGANGISHDRHNLYVTNFDYGAILRFPIRRDGSAGEPETVVQSCEYQGAKSVAAEGHGSLLFSNQLKNALYRVTRDGTVTLLLSGKPPFDQPGHMRIAGHGQHRRLLVPNFARNSVLANDNPLVQLLSIALEPCNDHPHGPR